MTKRMILMVVMSLVLAMVSQQVKAASFVLYDDVFFPSKNPGNGGSYTLDGNRGGYAQMDFASSVGKFNLGSFSPALISEDGTLKLSIWQDPVGADMTGATIDVRHLSINNYDYPEDQASRGLKDVANNISWIGTRTVIFDDIAGGTNGTPMASHTITAAQAATVAGGGFFDIELAVPQADLLEAVNNRSGVLSLFFTCDACEGTRDQNGDPLSSNGGVKQGWVANGSLVHAAAGNSSAATLFIKVVPEPATLSLLGMGGLGLLRRRR